MSPKESYFVQAVKKMKASKWTEAEKDLKNAAKKKSAKSGKAEILLAALQVRKECQKLLKEMS